MCWFQRVRVYVGGCLLEDVLYSNRVGSMLDQLKPPQRLWSESIEMLGQVNDDNAPNYDVSYAAGPRNQPIPANSRQTDYHARSCPASSRRTTCSRDASR
jgi:hypothetical protein